MGTRGRRRKRRQAGREGGVTQRLCDSTFSFNLQPHWNVLPIPLLFPSLFSPSHSSLYASSALRLPVFPETCRYSSLASGAATSVLLRPLSLDYCARAQVHTAVIALDKQTRLTKAGHTCSPLPSFYQILPHTHTNPITVQLHPSNKIFLCRGLVISKLSSPAAVRLYDHCDLGGMTFLK